MKKIFTIFDKITKKYKRFGFLGLLEKLFFRMKKSFFKIWYIKRFESVGKGVIFEGLLNLTGAKGITLGKNITFGRNVTLFCDDNAKMVIEDGCYISNNVIVRSTDYVLIGAGSSIQESTIIFGSGIKIGKNAWIARYCSVNGAEITIDDDCILAPFVYVLDTDHYIEQGSGGVSMDAGATAPVKIEKKVWICNGAKILKGVSVGAGAIIAAGAVVTKDVKQGTMVGGVPAGFLKEI